MSKPIPGSSKQEQDFQGTSNHANSTKKEGLSRLLEKQLEEIDNITEKINIWTKYRDDYQGLRVLVNNIQDKVRHPYRVPIAGSQLAFVKGHIIHTNEFYVLLGDNYFALRSARQADKIIGRRLDEVNEKLNKEKDAKRKLEDWFRYSAEHKREKEELVEIVETM